MFECFHPDLYIESVKKLPINRLKQMGIKAIVFDIDNTLTPFDEAEADDETVEVIDNLKKEGFKVCLLSNNNENRIKKYNEKLGMYVFWRAGKPGTKKLLEAVDKMGVTKASTAMVGDQAFTDVWCAKRAGILAIMTAPLCDRDQFVTKIKRPLERVVMSFYFRRKRKDVDE